MKRFTLTLWLLWLALCGMNAQTPDVSGTLENPTREVTPGKRVNFGVKGGFTSSLFIVSDLVVNGVAIEEVQNNYKIGYFGSFFMRVNFRRHFIQPEISYAINRSDITFSLPVNEENLTAPYVKTASVESSIHSIDIPVLYGYHIVRQHPYNMALFAGPKFRYIWGHKSETKFHNMGELQIDESLRPLNLGFSMGVAVSIAPIFFDFRYDISLHNISRRVRYEQPMAVAVDPTRSSIRFRHRDNVLSFSLGVLF